MSTRRSKLLLKAEASGECVCLFIQCHSREGVFVPAHAFIPSWSSIAFPSERHQSTGGRETGAWGSGLCISVRKRPGERHRPGTTLAGCTVVPGNKQRCKQRPVGMQAYSSGVGGLEINNTRENGGGYVAVSTSPFIQDVLCCYGCHSPHRQLSIPSNIAISNRKPNCFTTVQNIRHTNQSRCRRFAGRRVQAITKNVVRRLVP